MFQHLLFFLQNLVRNVIGNRMEAVLDDDVEVDQEIVTIPVKDAELLEAYSTSHGVTTIHLNNNSKCARIGRNFLTRWKKKQEFVAVNLYFDIEDGRLKLYKNKIHLEIYNF